MDTAELLRRVRKVEIKTRNLSRHIFSGAYHSAFKGRGMSFSEVRSYQYGDEVRDIDWNVTARTGEPHVKVFEEERELTVMLLVDVSPSVYFGTQDVWKHEWIAELCAVIGFSALQNNDKVGLILFTDRVELFIPPKKGRQHVLRIIRELLYFKPAHTQSRADVPLACLMQVVSKRCIAFLISDFQVPSFEEPLRLAARKHDVIGLHIYDPAESALPDSGLVQVHDPETGLQSVIDTGSIRVRKYVQEKFEQNVIHFRNQFLKAKADTLSLASNQPYVQAFHRFFKSRSSS